MLAEHLAAELAEEIERLIGQLNAGLSELGMVQSAQHPEVLSDLFRSAHSLKALYSTGGFDRQAQQVHEFEIILNNLRLGRQNLDRRTLSNLKEMARTIEGQGDSTASVIPRTRSEKNVASNGDSALVDRLELATDVRGALTEYEDHRLAENLRLNRRICEVKVRFNAKSFDKELAKLREQLNHNGEVLSVLPEPGEEKSHVDFRLLYATAKSISAVRSALTSQTAEVTEIPLGSKPTTRNLSTTFDILASAAERLADLLGKQVDVLKHGSDIALDANLVEGRKRAAPARCQKYRCAWDRNA